MILKKMPVIKVMPRECYICNKVTPHPLIAVMDGDRLSGWICKECVSASVQLRDAMRRSLENDGSFS